MTADFNKPDIDGLYTEILEQVRTNIEALVKQQFSDALNVPTDAIRFHSVNRRWEIWNGSTWNALAAIYAITVDNAQSLGGEPASAFVKIDAISSAVNNSSATHVASSAAVKAVKDALNTHQNAANPHAQYLRPVDADARYYTQDQSDANYAGNVNPNPNTLVKRTANGDIQAHKFRSTAKTVADAPPATADIAFRLTDSDDNEISFMTLGQLREWLGVYTKDETVASSNVYSRAYINSAINALDSRLDALEEVSGGSSGSDSSGSSGDGSSGGSSGGSGSDGRSSGDSSGTSTAPATPTTGGSLGGNNAK